MSHYIVARITIEDRSEYTKYEAGFVDVFRAYQGIVLSVDEAPVVLEGSWPCTRTVLLEFPSADAAMGWYQSDAYQQLAQHRFAASASDVVMISGLP